MPGAILHHRNGALPIIDCEVKFPASRGGVVGTPALSVKALVDTGATHVVINPQLAHILALPRDGDIDHTVVGHTPKSVPAHLCDVTLHGTRFLHPHSAFAYTIPDRRIVTDTLSGFDMILGWDVISLLDLTFARNGTLTINLG